MSSVELINEYDTIPSDPIYHNISEDTLTLTSEIYISLVSCPDNVIGTIQFYQNLFENFPAKTIIKTLARLLYMSRDKQVTEHFRTASYFFKEITSSLNLQYKNIAAMTTGFHHLKKYPDLKDHRVRKAVKIEDY